MTEQMFDSAALKPKACGLKPDFVELSPDGPAAPGWDYLLRRGLSHDQLVQATGRYRLCYDVEGRRVIYPHYACGIVVGWTSRVIDPTTFKRYCSFPVDQAQRFVLYDADRVCRPGPCVFICEGPLDAICVWLAGQRIGAASTALFGAWASPIQHACLLGLRQLYDRMSILLDADAYTRGLSLATQLDVGVIDIGQEYDDPSAMGVDELRRLVELAAQSSEQRISWPMARPRLQPSGFGPRGRASEADCGTPTLEPEARGLEPDQCR